MRLCVCVCVSVCIHVSTFERIHCLICVCICVYSCTATLVLPSTPTTTTVSRKCSWSLVAITGGKTSVFLQVMRRKGNHQHHHRYQRERRGRGGFRGNEEMKMVKKMYVQIKNTIQREKKHNLPYNDSVTFEENTFINGVRSSPQIMC